MSRPKTGSIFKRGRIYYIAYTDSAGVQIKESSGSIQREDADRLLKRRQGEVVNGKFQGLAPERVTFGELAPLIVDDYLENERKSLAWVERRLKLHLLPQIAKVRAAEFSSDHLTRYRQMRKKQKASNASINRELAIVKRIFNLALESDPPKIARMPHVKMLEESNVRAGFLDHEQYLRFRDKLPEELRLFLVVAYHIGARSGELLPLKWTQVDLEALEITLHPGETKNDQGRPIPIYGDMIEWLKIEKAIRDQNYPSCPWVFHRQGKRIRSFRTSWDKAAQAAAVGRILPHDLRRSAARKMSRAGIPDKIIMAVTGHKTRAMLDRYNIVSRSDLAVFRGRMAAEESLRKRAESEYSTSPVIPVLSQSSDSNAGKKGAKASKLLN
jgi:integrase